MKIIFNPLDFGQFRNINNLKIRIKSPDGNILIDKSIFTEGATIGRSEKNIINFPKEKGISSHHAEIFFDNLKFYLRDKGSK